MAKSNRYPKFDLRMDSELYDWLKDFSAQSGKPMATIIKAELQRLRHREVLKTVKNLEAIQGYNSYFVTKINDTLNQLYTDHDGACPYCLMGVGLGKSESLDIYKAEGLEALVGHVYLNHPDEIQRILMVTPALNPDSEVQGESSGETAPIPDAEPSIRVKVIGVGSGGNRALCQMADSELPGVEYYAVDTDLVELRKCEGVVRIQIGMNTTGEIGTGGDIEKGRNAAEADKDKLKAIVDGADMVFVITGMGGGVGSGAAPIIARLAKEAGALTFGVVTRPFDFEGQHRITQAEEGIQNIRESTDTVAVILNQHLIGDIYQKMPIRIRIAFGQADEVLRQTLESLLNLLSITGSIRITFADIQAVLSNAGDMFVGTGTSSGDNRAHAAAQAAISAPWMEKGSVEGSENVIVTVTASPDMKMHELEDAVDVVRNAAKTENFIFGLLYDDDLQDKLRVTVIAAGEKAPEEKAQE